MVLEMDHTHATPAAANEAQRSAHSAMDAALDYLGHLSPELLAHLGEHYTADARFKDPFQEVWGLEAVRAVYAHMFETLEQPRFVITSRVQDGAACFVTWDFEFAVTSWQGGRAQCIKGASQLLMRQEHGVWRIASHRDYWDAAEELYEKIPLLGALMRWLKRRVAVPGLDAFKK
jgi:ketosteroid isomerase-like protein